MVCCSCENIPVNTMNWSTCCSVTNDFNSSKNAINRSPVTSGDRSWKHAKRFCSQINNSQAVVILFDGDVTSESVLCSNARGPSTGIIADWKYETKIVIRQFLKLNAQMSNSTDLHAKWYQLCAFPELIWSNPPPIEPHFPHKHSERRLCIHLDERYHPV